MYAESSWVDAELSERATGVTAPVALQRQFEGSHDVKLEVKHGQELYSKIYSISPSGDVDVGILGLLPEKGTCMPLCTIYAEVLNRI